MKDLPEEIRYKIEVKGGRELQQEPVVRVFIESDRPYLTRRQVQGELKGEYARGTVIDRLKELCEIGILETDERKGGNIYWLSNEKSDWPIPPDVRVEPEKEKMTVSEFFSLQSIRIMAFGIGGILVSTILIWTGGMVGGAGYTFLGVAPRHIISVGLLSTFLGWIIVGYGLYHYLQTRISD